MTDLRKTIIPKSDQLNADDLIGTTKTIKVTKVSLAAGDQPIAINYDGDGGKPYLPCKSMRRVMVNVWGCDGNEYVGRSMTLYRDDKVTFGGMAVGGIRISHMSHIDKDVTMALTATRANRKPYTVKPLVQSHASSDKSGSQGNVGSGEPIILTEQQQKDLWAKAKAKGIAPDDFKASFGSLKTFPVSQLAEAEKWIAAYGQEAQEPCEFCGQVGGHTDSCPDAEPPQDDLFKG